MWETSDLVKNVFFINKLHKTCKQSLVLSVSLPGSSRKCFALPNSAVFQKCHLSSAVILTFLTRLARTMNSEAGYKLKGEVSSSQSEKTEEFPKDISLCHFPLREVL